MLWSVIRVIFKTSSVTPDFFYVFNLVLSFSTCSQSFNKICVWEVLGANVLKDVRANCFCASLLRTAARANSHATSCIERARQVLKWTMIGQIAIAIALLIFNDLGRSVTPTFLFRNRFYLQLSQHCLKMNKKINMGSLKNFKISVHGT